MFSSMLILVITVYVMRKCSSSFDIAANYLTRGLGEGVKGPTVNAVASSLPELLISSLFLFYFKDVTGFSAGYATIIGSSAFNIALIPVISFAYVYFSKGEDKVFHINKMIVKQDALFLLGAISILSIGFFTGVTVYFSLLLMLFYFIYIYYIIKKRVANKDDNQISSDKFLKDNNLVLRESNIYGESGISFSTALFSIKLFRIFFNGKVNVITSIVVLLISVFIIGLSCYMLVIATENISHILGINLFFGAFIIAAIASSIPDTILSVQDAKNDRFIDSFSNAYGSNIFDICIGIGLPVFIYTLIYGPINMNMPITRAGWIGDYIFAGNIFLWSLIVLFVFTVLVSLVYYRNNLRLRQAIQILLLYLIFIIALMVF